MNPLKRSQVLAGAPKSHFESLSLIIVQLLSRVQLFATPWTAANHPSLSFTISLSLLKLMSTELVMPSNHLILCQPVLLPSIFPSIRVFSSESALIIFQPHHAIVLGKSFQVFGLNFLIFKMEGISVIISLGCCDDPITIHVMYLEPGLYRENLRVTSKIFILFIFKNIYSFGCAGS